MKVIIGKKAMIEEKERLYRMQDRKCCICHRELNPNIQENHLDHDHALEGANAGKIRGLLCLYCNPLEGEIKHKFDSSGLKSKGVDYIKWLENQLSYYKSDLTNSNLHPNYIVDKVNKFKTLNKPEMVLELTSIGTIIPEKATKAILIELYRKDFRKHIKVTYNE